VFIQNPQGQRQVGKSRPRRTGLVSHFFRSGMRSHLEITLAVFVELSVVRFALAVRSEQPDIPPG
jgi:hypothetical protein